MPKLLNAFLGIIIHQPKKLAAIGHSIVQTATPRTVIAPILFGLRVSLVDLVGWLQPEMVYPSEDGHPSQL